MVHLTGNPQSSFGIVQTEVGPAQLLHCYKHRDNVAIALFVLPLRMAKWEYYGYLDWDRDGDLQYLSSIIDEARGRRMVSSMGLCTECVADAITSGFDWLKLTFIFQEVKNWSTNTTKIFGAFGGDPEMLDFYRLHLINADVDWEIKFVGHMQSIIKPLCPTCIRDMFSKNLFRSLRSVRTMHLLYGANNVGG